MSASSASIPKGTLLAAPARPAKRRERAKKAVDGHRAPFRRGSAPRASVGTTRLRCVDMIEVVAAVFGFGSIRTW